MWRWRIFLWFDIPSASLRLTLRGRLRGRLTNHTKIVTTHNLTDNNMLKLSLLQIYFLSDLQNASFTNVIYLAKLSNCRVVHSCHMA